MSDQEAIRIFRVKDQVFGINSYCVVSGNHAFWIDPVITENLKHEMSKWKNDFAIVTHEHYDHICSISELQAVDGIYILCGEKAARGLSEPSLNLSLYMEYIIQATPFGDGSAQSCDYRCHADDILHDSQKIEWQGHKLYMKETPGHSKGSISVLVDEQFLFSGDTIFKDYPTATRMPGGSTKAFQTITEPWLDSLPQDIIVYPGHTEPFRLYERYKK